MLSDTNGADARATASVGDTESLVEVEVANVCADGAGTSERHLCVHVGAVHVHLTSAAMHCVDDTLHLLLEHTICYENYLGD
jgi:hypothetical protein